jgi:hypothetical protein
MVHPYVRVGPCPGNTFGSVHARETRSGRTMPEYIMPEYKCSETPPGPVKCAHPDAWRDANVFPAHAPTRFFHGVVIPDFSMVWLSPIFPWCGYPRFFHGVVIPERRDAPWCILTEAHENQGAPWCDRRPGQHQGAAPWQLRQLGCTMVHPYVRVGPCPGNTFGSVHARGTRSGRCMPGKHALVTPPSPLRKNFLFFRLREKIKNVK